MLKYVREQLEKQGAFTESTVVEKDELDDNLFTEDELEIIKRARNHKSISHPKNCDIVTYRYATGFEALIGYLKLDNNEERIKEIMKNILK